MNPIFKTLDQLDITPELSSAYSRLISQLKGKECVITEADLQEVKDRSSSELVLLLYIDEKLSGTAQASYLCVPDTYGAYLNSVVVDELFRGKGLGALLMEELEKRVKARWTKVQKITLTSSPQKGTQGFYLKLGYKMRTKEEGDETIVYVKNI